MPQVLDNPVWHALIGPHTELAIGQGSARHYPRDVAPFSAIGDATATAYSDLATDLPDGMEARLFRAAYEPAPDGWETISAQPIVQMVADTPVSGKYGEAIALGDDDVAAMRALAERTKPGPFGPRTSQLGHYIGYREGGRLIAMGGERMRLAGFVELSAICVDADARGRGLGASITSQLVCLAASRGETAFLHVFPDNPAIALYRRLGFRERARLWVIWRRRR